MNQYPNQNPQGPYCGPQGQYPNPQQYQQNYPYPPQKPSNNLVWAILSTILCCLPLGIVAIVYAAKVDSLWAQGDYMGAQDASNKAKMWSLIGAGISLVIGIIYAICLIFMASTGMAF